MGYHQDTPAAIVFQASNQLQHCVQESKCRKKETQADSSYLWESVSKTSLLKELFMNELTKVEVGSEQWQRVVRYMHVYIADANTICLNYMCVIIVAVSSTLKVIST